MTATNVFLDLLSSAEEDDYYGRLREESSAVFTSNEEWGSQASVGKLTHIDSTIRESLRRSPVITKSGLREVVKREGL